MLKNITDIKSHQRKQRKLKKRLSELDKFFSSLYEDKVMEKITERNFSMVSAKYEKEQFEIEAKIKAIDVELESKNKTDVGVTDFLSLIKNYQGITELNATIINALIDKITISERKKHTDGQLVQVITIYYKFVGCLDEFTMNPPKQHWQMEEKTCAECSATFIPGSNVAKYCPTCRKERNRINSNESKRRSRGKARTENLCA